MWQSTLALSGLCVGVERPRKYDPVKIWSLCSSVKLTFLVQSSSPVSCLPLPEPAQGTNASVTTDYTECTPDLQTLLKFNTYTTRNFATIRKGMFSLWN